MMHFYGFENSEYSDIVAGGKNTYLSSGIITDCENVLYSCSIKDASRNVFGSVMVWDTNENIYECSGIIKSYNVFYSNNIDTSSNIWFSSNLVGCTECILCDSLTNQSYIIANIQYSEEEYTTKKTDLLSRKKIFQDLRAKV